MKIKMQNSAPYLLGAIFPSIQNKKYVTAAYNERKFVSVETPYLERSRMMKEDEKVIWGLWCPH